MVLPILENIIKKTKAVKPELVSMTTGLADCPFVNISVEFWIHNVQLLLLLLCLTSSYDGWRHSKGKIH